MSNLSRAQREYSKGVTTTTGKVVRDDSGKAITYSLPEAIVKAAGFKPSFGGTKEKNRMYRKSEIQTIWNDYKVNTVTKIRDAIGSGDNDRATELRNSFNQDLVKFVGKNKYKPVSPITKVER